MGGEHPLKISAPQLLRFGIDSVLKILNERMTDSINESMSDGGVGRTAPATPVLLMTKYNVKHWFILHFTDLHTLC